MSAIRKLDLMHREFGRCDGHTCRECCNLISVTPTDRTVKKCQVYGATASEATDWAGRWLACGMFNRAYVGRPMIEILKHSREKAAPPEPLENQICLF